jgi:hypothetical protein
MRYFSVCAVCFGGWVKVLLSITTKKTQVATNQRHSGEGRNPVAGGNIKSTFQA